MDYEFIIIWLLAASLLLVAVLTHRRHRHTVKNLTRMFNQMMESNRKEWELQKSYLEEAVRKIKQEKDAKIDEVEKRSTAFQDRLSVLLTAERFGGREWDQILRLVENNRLSYIACATAPQVDFTTGIPTLVNKGYIDMVRFGISIGLSKETPPEIVASQIADNVKLAVLKKWQEQSALLLLEKS